MTAMIEAPCPAQCRGGMAGGEECRRCCGHGTVLVGRAPEVDPRPRLSEAALDRAEFAVRRVLSASMETARSQAAAPVIVRGLLAWRPGRDAAGLVEQLALVSRRTAEATVDAFIAALEEHGRVVALPGYGRDPFRSERERRELDALTARMRAAA